MQDRQNVPNVSIQVKHKPNGAITTSIRASSQKTAEAFPALNADTTPPEEPQWVQLKPKKCEPRVTKIAEAPVLPPSSTLNDFPTLKKTDKKTVPVKAKTKKKKAKATTSGSEAADLHQNGLVKKRSELKIANLDAAVAAAAVTAPPGFPARPPPGFAERNSALANDLTFTNSTGRTYSIRPITKYIQPENFAKRNRDLIEKCMAVLNNGEAIREFRNYSNLFRGGTLPARMFYDHCKVVLGDKFDEVFPELLVLLPDIEKQQELYKSHMEEGKTNDLVVCEGCNQILFKMEVKHHNTYHNLDFPPLRK